MPSAPFSHQATLITALTQSWGVQPLSAGNEEVGAGLFSLSVESRQVHLLIFKWFFCAIIVAVGVFLRIAIIIACGRCFYRLKPHYK